MKMKKLGLLFMMLCMVFAVNAQELKKGDKLPDFHLKSAVYGDVSSAELKGKVVLVSIDVAFGTEEYRVFAFGTK